MDAHRIKNRQELSFSDNNRFEPRAARANPVAEAVYRQSYEEQGSGLEMTRHRQTDSELMEHLYEQMGFLRRSAEDYDAGDFSEAKRLATNLRVLLHDAKKSKSLLAQLGLKKELRFIDTAGPIGRDSFEFLPGGRFRASIGIAVPLAPIAWGSWKGFLFIARLDDHRTNFNSLPFHTWWTSPVVAIPPKFRLSRRDLVLGVANQDGGAHVDETLREQFAGIARQRFIVGSRKKPLSIAIIQNPELKGPPNPSLPMIRQIAYELTKTLEGRLEDLP